jgi:hypothetical protein
MFSFDLNKIKLDRGMTLFAVGAGMVLPPLILIFDFAPKLFNELDTVKLLFLSLAIGAGGMVANIVACMPLVGLGRKPFLIETNTIWETAPIAAILNFVTFGAPSAIAFVSIRHVTQNRAVGIAAVFPIAIFAGMILISLMFTIMEKIDTWLYKRRLDKKQE